MVEMDGVHEYMEGLPVALAYEAPPGRIVVVATNEAGYQSTQVDLLDLLEWLERHPDWMALLSDASQSS